jgi:RNA polymerase sigma factor (sigma-70 family)
MPDQCERCVASVARCALSSSRHDARKALPMRAPARSSGNDARMRGDEQTRTEFDASFPGLVTVACHAARRFFRFDESVVRNAVAETMAQTYERWGRVRHHDDPAGWVIVRTKDVCLEFLRAKSETEDQAISEDIVDNLDRLSKRQRDVAVLRYLMDCDEATTAVALGTTESKVHTRAERARQRIRGDLERVYGLAGGAPI